QTPGTTQRTIRGVQVEASLDKGDGALVVGPRVVGVPRRWQGGPGERRGGVRRHFEKLDGGGEPLRRRTGAKRQNERSDRSQSDTTVGDQDDSPSMCAYTDKLEPSKPQLLALGDDACTAEARRLGS